MSRLLRKSGIMGIVLLHMWIFLVFPVHAFTQDQARDAGSACMDAEAAASSNTSGGSWFAIGCLLTWVGWLIAYSMEPSPPATAMLGKSPEYVASYSDCYKRKAKDIRSRNALIGCLVGTAAWIIVNVVLWTVVWAAEEELASDYYY
jgi:hypothetical protein